MQPLELDGSSGRDPALPVAGGDTSNAGDIDVSVDVALRDAGFEQIPTLGLGVHAGPVSLLLPAGADVAVHRHGTSPDQAGLDRRCRRHMAVHFLRATAGGRIQRLGHSSSVLTVDADVRGLIAVSALSLSHPRSPMSKGALNHDTFSATPSQGWSIRNSAPGGKGAFPASDRCGHSGKHTRAGERA